MSFNGDSGGVRTHALSDWRGHLGLRNTSRVNITNIVSKERSEEFLKVIVELLDSAVEEIVDRQKRQYCVTAAVNQDTYDATVHWTEIGVKEGGERLKYIRAITTRQLRSRRAA